MIDSESVMELIEANHLMSEVINKLFRALIQVSTVEEIEQMDVLERMKRAAIIMKDYE